MNVLLYVGKVVVRVEMTRVGKGEREEGGGRWRRRGRRRGGGERKK